jgi:hypothetical protein
LVYLLIGLFVYRLNAAGEIIPPEYKAQPIEPKAVYNNTRKLVERKYCVLFMVNCFVVQMCTGNCCLENLTGPPVEKIE